MDIAKTESYIVPGFLAGGIHAGIKENGLKDLALIFSTLPAKASGVFTTNAFKAAPVLLDQERIKAGTAQAIVVNSGNANAATGAEGYEDAVSMSRSASRHLGIPEEHVLVSSTGIIGHRLPVKKIEKGMGQLVKVLREDGLPEAEEAIMTTDKFPKMAIRKSDIGGKDITVCGIAKGAGMIEPHMATMLAFVMTNVNIDLPVLKQAFKLSADLSFNAVTVDGCMSTNDTAIILANGVAGNPLIKGTSKTLKPFCEMLLEVMTDLARSIVRDGEGATKIIEVVVEEADTVDDAKKIAYSVANSNLVKTAVYGCDPNWGRILQAVGSSGPSIAVDSVRLFFEDVPVFANGCGVNGYETELAKIMKEQTIKICIKLGMGKKTFRVCASDLSYDYVKINAHYHT
jgi:glutamate N-acetyltransferase / amino-acid N-acetyltransferase